MYFELRKIAPHNWTACGDFNPSTYGIAFDWPTIGVPLPQECQTLWRNTAVAQPDVPNLTPREFYRRINPLLAWLNFGE